MQSSRTLARGLPLFAALSEEDLAQALADARACRIAKGESVFRQGEPARHFFVLVSGHLQTQQLTPAGERVVVRYVCSGDVFGIARALAMTTYPASSIAVQDSLVLRWPSSAWERLNHICAPFACHVVRTVGQRLQEAHTRIQELSTERVEQRLAHALLRLARQSGRISGDAIAIDFPLSRQDLAEMTGTTLHTVSRLLSAWKALGLLHLGRQRVVLLDLEKLALHAERAALGYAG